MQDAQRIGFHIKLIRLFLRDHFATLHRWYYIFSIDNVQKLYTVEKKNFDESIFSPQVLP